MNSTSSNNSSSSSDDDNYNVMPLLDCFTLRIIGIYLVLLFVTSVSFNTFHFWIFYKTKKLLNPINAFMNTLVGVNLFATLAELPMVIHSTFNCKFIFGKLGCIIEGYILYFTGCISIYLLAVISIERHYMLHSPTVIRLISFKLCIMIISICALMSAFWASAPLLGWSFYSLEGSKITCGVEWNTHTTLVSSYNIAVFVFVFTAPVSIIITANLLVIRKIRLSNLKLVVYGLGNVTLKRKFEKQKNITKITALLMIFFLISWIPYTIVSLYSAFFNRITNPLLATLPALFAKSSLIWAAFLNVIINKAFKTYLPCMTMK